MRIKSRLQDRESNWAKQKISVRPKVNKFSINARPTVISAKHNVTFTIDIPNIVGACLTVYHDDKNPLYGWKSSKTIECEGNVIDKDILWQEEVSFSTGIIYNYSFPYPDYFNMTARWFSVTGDVLVYYLMIVVPPLPCSAVTMNIQDGGTLKKPLNITRSQKFRLPLSTNLVNCSETVNTQIRKL